MKNEKQELTKTATNKEAVYIKTKLLKAPKYTQYTDVLAVLLEDDKSYTISKVDAMLDKFLKKGKVFK